MNIETHIQSAIKRLNELGELEQNASLAECRGHLLLVEGIIKTLRYIEIKLDRNEQICP